MKVAIMQPYLFPYLGYFQLIRAVDAFVVYDDVNYINRGWINRNNILAQGAAQRLTLELESASQNKYINEIVVGNKGAKVLKAIRHNYGRAPYFIAVYPVVEKILMQPERNLACFLNYGLQQVCSYLGLNPAWHMSSSLNKNNALRGQDKILAICEELSAKQYINMPGGKGLYDSELFAGRNMQLSFIQPKPVSYNQFGNEFVANLSIIDVLMFNNKEQCAKLLGEYELV